MLLKFRIIWTRIDQVVRLRNDINFSETPCPSLMISIFFFNTPCVCVCVYVCESVVCVCVCVCVYVCVFISFVFIAFSYCTLSRPVAAILMNQQRNRRPKLNISFSDLGGTCFSFLFSFFFFLFSFSLFLSLCLSFFLSLCLTPCICLPLFALTSLKLNPYITLSLHSTYWYYLILASLIQEDATRKIQLHIKEVGK